MDETEDINVTNDVSQSNEEDNETPVTESSNETDGATNNSFDEENNYLQNLLSPGSSKTPAAEENESDADEETTESISDISEFINQLTEMVKPSTELNTNNNEAESNNEIEANEDESYNEIEDNNEIDDNHELTLPLDATEDQVDSGVESQLYTEEGVNDDNQDDGCHGDNQDEESDYVNYDNDECNLSQEETFKMPDSFDIPSDYINELIPSKSAPISSTSTPAPVPPKVTQGSDNTKPTSQPHLHPVASLHDDPKAGTSLSFDEIFNDDMLDNDNTPIQDDVVQITYKKDSTSKRARGPVSSNKRDPRKDRRKFMASLFNDSESSDEDSPTEERPPSSLTDELEEKRNRMKEKLKGAREGGVKKLSTRDEVTKKYNLSKVGSKSQIPSSSGNWVRRQQNEEDSKFIVSDNEDISEPDSDEDQDDYNERRKRLDERKKRKGGDVLAWMTRRAKVSVTVQPTPTAYIQDMAQYR